MRGVVIEDDIEGRRGLTFKENIDSNWIHD